MSSTDPSTKPTQFISLRWRFLLPLFIVVLIPAMIFAYALSSSGGIASSVLTTNTDFIRNQFQRVLEAQQANAIEMVDAYANDLPQLEAFARQANLDSVVIIGADGTVSTSLARLIDGDSYENINITSLPLNPERATWVETPSGVLLYAGATSGSGVTGFTGRYLDRILEEMRGSSAAEVVVYTPDGRALGGTLSEPPPLSPSQTALRAGEVDYTTSTFPVDGATISVLVPAAMLASSGATQQLAGMTIAVLVAGVVVVGFVAVNWTVNRAERVSRVANALATGDSTARTGMKPSDEIGTIGEALDRYADYVQKRQDALRTTLRRQRREIAHLTAILEMLPDGVIVQDADGRVVFTNDRARELLGSQGLAEGAGVEQITAVVTDVLGPALAPGLYALGNPQQVELNGRMISAQVAAVTSFSNQRVGKVALLRDITEEVRRARAQEALLKRMSAEVQKPLADVSQSSALQEPTALAEFAHEISRHAVALQKLIVEMRELSADLDTRSLKRVQRSIPLETLIWAVANEWRQIAQAANLKLLVQIERSGLHVLGDERRLRWAIGNLLDNAMKYTPPGGSVTLEIKGEENGTARLRIRDNGVGISAEELPHVFTRFYRGSPTTKEGRAIRVPGTGQGLTVAKDIIEAHGGQIQVRSQPGVGTAVYFTLPLTAPVSMELPGMTDDYENDGETEILQPRKARGEA